MQCPVDLRRILQREASSRSSTIELRKLHEDGMGRIPGVTFKVYFRIVPQMLRIVELKQARRNTLQILQQYRTAVQIRVSYKIRTSYPIEPYHRLFREENHPGSITLPG